MGSIKSETFAWTPRQFVAGNVSLDLANTVIYRDDDVLRHDRLATTRQVAEWCRMGRIGGTAPTSTAALDALIQVRESTDRLFRAVAQTTPLPPGDFAMLLTVYAECVKEGAIRCGAEGMTLVPAGRTRHMSLLAVAASAAIELATSRWAGRVRACDACGWLFVDKSRNGRRRWCDMATCGNRAKARRRYRRHRAAGAGGPAGHP